MKLPSQLKPKNLVSTLQSKTDARVSQKVQDFTKASKQKLESELAGTLSRQKLADGFTKLSSELDLKKINNKMAVLQRGSNTPLAEIQDIAPNDVTAAGNSIGPTTNFKVRLVAYPQLGPEAGDEVIFDIMPSISESHSAQYDTVDVVHHPGAILKYKSTSAREWSVTADFVSRTVQEATDNLRRLNLIRSWVMPFYGVGTGNTYAEKLGGPPQILKFFGFGPKMIGEASVVLTSFNWAFEPEIDYIFAGDTPETRTPFPVHIRVQLQLSETWAPNQFTKFNLKDYREGNMPAAFGASSMMQTRTSPEVDSSRVDTSQPQSATNASISTATVSGVDVSSGSSNILNNAANQIQRRIRSVGPI